MALDLFGPTVGAGGVTVRPSETRAFTSTDTFFRDCSSPDLDDGTEFDAAWFNEVTATLRAFARGNGQTAGSADVVTQDNADDNILLKAMQHLIQRGQPLYGEDTSSTVNIITAAVSPAPAEYKKGMTVNIKIANANTGKTQINLNGLGLVSVKRPDGTDPLDSDLPAGAVPSLRYDGTNFQIIGADARPRLKRNTTIYVRTADGNDANDGTANDAAHALATLQAAYNLAWSYSPSQYTITIQLADGTYVGAATPFYAGPNVVVNGNNVSPSNVIVEGGTGTAILVQGPNTQTVSNLKVQATGGSGGQRYGIAATAGAAVTTSNTVSGACANPVFTAIGGSIVCGNHTFAGNCESFWYATRGGYISLNSGFTYTISTAITVSTATAQVANTGSIQNSLPAPNFANPSNVTGKRYQAVSNGTIDTQGSGASYFPGSVAGTTNSGGQYL